MNAEYLARLLVAVYSASRTHSLDRELTIRAIMTVLNKHGASGPKIIQEIEDHMHANLKPEWGWNENPYLY